MIKIPEKLYRIGELVRYTPFSRQTLHNYTIMGLIRESQWTQGGHRLYDESVFEKLSK
ncbi:MAG: MerR family transcriptional regulator, partial [Planctomycetes bacterium]|nr:MerR family transcriptional regulator [Planctomycetota bacterium]